MRVVARVKTAIFVVGLVVALGVEIWKWAKRASST